MRRPLRSASRTWGPPILALAVSLAVLVSCTGRDSLDSGALDDQPATGSEMGDVTIIVDAGHELGEISPLLRGVSGDLDPDEMVDAGTTVNSWGGNPATRYNYELGNAWNAGRDWEYRNTNFGNDGDTAVTFLTETMQAGATARVAVPTLGWVARNDDDRVCSFPVDGGCSDADGASCEQPGPIADPAVANVRSTPDGVRNWLRRLVVDQGLDIGFVGMDNEPELWGVSHYDVHPLCTTFDEVRDRYLEYATAIRDVVPDAKLMGPVTCCWFTYWGTAPGGDHGDDFLSWFLGEVRDHDQRLGRRSLDVVDVHYYPQSDVFNDDVGDETSARRLRSTRSLWDPGYVDESWIAEPIQFVPRLRQLIDRAYPGTPLGISEWNFGADGTMNGALAIADVLGIYGREGVYLASYWRSPAPGSPGYFAFKMHGNYDGLGSSFGGTAVEATSPDVDRVASFAAIDPSNGHLKVMLLNKQPGIDTVAQLDFTGFAAESATLYGYSDADPDSIVTDEVDTAQDSLTVTLPAYSITLLDLAAG